MARLQRQFDKANERCFNFCSTPRFGSPVSSPRPSREPLPSPSTLPEPPPPFPVYAPDALAACVFPSEKEFEAFFSASREEGEDLSDSAVGWPFAYDPYTDPLDECGRPRDTNTRFTYGPYLYPPSARTVVPVALHASCGDGEGHSAAKRGAFSRRRRGSGGFQRARDDSQQDARGRKVGEEQSSSTLRPRNKAVSRACGGKAEPADGPASGSTAQRPRSRRGDSTAAGEGARGRGRNGAKSSSCPSSSSEEEEQLPVFGTQRVYRRRVIMKQVRPVPVYEVPLREDSLPLPPHWEKSTFVSPPTEDETRRLKHFPEEMARRAQEDGAVFKREYHPFLRQYLDEKTARLRRRLREKAQKQREKRMKELSWTGDKDGGVSGHAGDENDEMWLLDDDEVQRELTEELRELVVHELERKQSGLTELEDEFVLLDGKQWTWTMWERDRWKRSTLLRRLMKEGKLLFKSDLEERQYATDYEQLMCQPFHPPRRDWGGYEYYASISLDKEDNKPLIDELLDEEDFERDARQRLKKEEEEELRNAEAEKERKKVIRMSQDKVIKFLEMAEGELPNLFQGSQRSRKKKHPKNCIVPFNRLKAHAEVIESITRCPFLQMDMERALCQGWRQRGCRRTQIKHMESPRGIPPDKYALTAEVMQKAANKLRVAIGDALDPVAVSAVKPKRLDRQAEPEKKLGGGRYAV
ncbi:hypothetical protein BESB_056680 [Besnoitia besnoiti]|uniref:Uncharacterized protein n=1 Tax=Besnoitia besnoiti TaxID=94643 RepID=A0A2A9MK82_BESBE|nr:hypothetical protein BESB_056680 [Besnoitia besnoiti]PFH36017.1 hypothetical protein BESB_056680 [Besnoitia besnoiti]